VGVFLLLKTAPACIVFELEHDAPALKLYQWCLLLAPVLKKAQCIFCNLVLSLRNVWRVN